MKNIDEVVTALRTEISSSDEDTVAVDLGCGTQPRNPLHCDKVIGLDIIPQNLVGMLEGQFEYRRLVRGESLPLDNDSVHVVYAFDFIEHLSRHADSEVSEFIGTMNEIWRILRPGGRIVAATPCWPSKAVFSDPTHTNPLSDQTHFYFSDHVWARKNGYGFYGSFRTVVTGWTSPGLHPMLWNKNSRESAPMAVGILSLGRISQRILRRRTSDNPDHFLWILEKASVN